MKNTAMIRNKLFMFCMGFVAIMGLLWSCAVEEYNPGIQAPDITSIEPSAAFAGMEVVIHGNNFSSAAAGNTVTIGGTAATVSETTTLEITAVVSEGLNEGSADVTVTTNNQTSSAHPFTVTLPIIPTITSIEPNTGKVGSEVIITGTDFSTTPGENLVSFNGTEATVSAATETSITTTVPAGATTGSVTVTVDGESNGVVFTVTLSSMLVVEISEDTDDAEEGGNNGKLTCTSSDLELGEYDTWTQDDVEQGLQTIGLRFNNITIPKGSTILAATIQFTADNIGSDPVQLTIYGENSSTPESFSEDVFFDITSRTRTVENAVWDVPPWINKGDAGVAQQTVDLASIVTAIVNREDWVSGNSMAFIMDHSGPSIGQTESSGGREAEANPGNTPAILTVIYD